MNKIAEVELTYKTKVKASEREKITRVSDIVKVINCFISPGQLLLINTLTFIL